MSDEGKQSDAGRQGAVGAWRNSFIRAPYQRNLSVGLGLVSDTFETSITWDRWPEFDARIHPISADAEARIRALAEQWGLGESANRALKALQSAAG